MELVFVVADSDLDYYVNLFLRFKRAVCRPRTVEWYEDVLTRHYPQATAGLDRNWPPTPAHLVVFLENIKARGLSEASISNYFRALRSFLNWAFRGRFLEQNPLDFVDAPKAPRPLPKAPPAEDMVRLLAAVSLETAADWRAARDLALFSLALDGGARIGELAALKLPDVDLVNGQVRVYSQKTYEDRVLEIGAATEADLRDWLKVRAELPLPVSLRRGALFVSDYQGKGLRSFTRSGMRQRLKFWQAKAGVEPFNFHAFRHAYAIYSLRNGADLMDVRDQMGHASIKTTAIYTEVVDAGRAERHRHTSPRGNLRKIDEG